MERFNEVERKFEGEYAELLRKMDGYGRDKAEIARYWERARINARASYYRNGYKPAMSLFGYYDI